LKAHIWSPILNNNVHVDWLLLLWLMLMLLKLVLLGLLWRLL
jgi:hypothetical protein